MSALLLLRAVAAARLLAVAHALGVQGAAHYLVPDAGQVPHPAAAHQHDRVLLQVVAHSGDVRRHLDVAGQPDPGDLAERRVRLLRRSRVYARANAAALGAPLERRRLVLAYLVLPALADQLLARGHRGSVFCSCIVRISRGAVVAAGRSELTAVALLTATLLPGPRVRACRRSRGAPGPESPGGGKKSHTPGLRINRGSRTRVPVITGTEIQDTRP